MKFSVNIVGVGLTVGLMLVCLCGFDPFGYGPRYMFLFQTMPIWGTNAVIALFMLAWFGVLIVSGKKAASRIVLLCLACGAQMVAAVVWALLWWGSFYWTDPVLAVLPLMMPVLVVKLREG